MKINDLEEADRCRTYCSDTTGSCGAGATALASPNRGFSSVESMRLLPNPPNSRSLYQRQRVNQPPVRANYLATARTPPFFRILPGLPLLPIHLPVRHPPASVWRHARRPVDAGEPFARGPQVGHNGRYAATLGGGTEARPACRDDEKAVNLLRSRNGPSRVEHQTTSRHAEVSTG